MRLKEAPRWWKRGKRSYYVLNYTITSIALGLLIYLYTQLGYHLIFILGFLSIAARTVYFSLESLQGSRIPKSEK